MTWASSLASVLWIAMIGAFLFAAAGYRILPGVW